MPDQVDVSAERKTYAPGDTARIHIAPPFAGEAIGAVAGARRRVENFSKKVSWTPVENPVFGA